MLNDPKTTVTAIIAVVTYLLLTFTGIDVPPTVKESAAVFFVFLIGLFARDGRRSSDE